MKCILRTITLTLIYKFVMKKYCYESRRYYKIMLRSYSGGLNDLYLSLNKLYVKNFVPSLYKIMVDLHVSVHKTSFHEVFEAYQYLNINNLERFQPSANGKNCISIFIASFQTNLLLWVCIYLVHLDRLVHYRFGKDIPHNIITYSYS